MSERGFSVTLENALDANDVTLAILCYVNWPSGAVRMWSGNGTISWNGFSWEGIGRFGSIDKIADGIDTSDIGVMLTFNYLDDTLRNEVITTSPVGRDASIYMAAMNVSTGAVSDAYEIFSGFVDTCEIYDAGENGQLKVRLASELARLRRPTFFALSDAHQRFLFAGDQGMEFASKMDEPITWGRKPTYIGSYPAPTPIGYDNWSAP